MGIESLTEKGKKYLEFAEAFEIKFMNQGEYERRTIEETLDLARDLLSILPEEELVIRDELIKKCHPKYRSQK